MQRQFVNLPISPELGDLSVRHDSSTEAHQSEQHQRIDQGSSDCIWHVGGDELSNAGVNEFVHEHDEEDRTSRGSSSWKPDGIVETEEELDSTNDQIWELGHDQRDHKRYPGVHLGLLLTCVINVSFLDEERLQLCC